MFFQIIVKGDFTQNGDKDPLFSINSDKAFGFSGSDGANGNAGWLSGNVTVFVVFVGTTFFLSFWSERQKIKNIPYIPTVIRSSVHQQQIG